MKTKLSAAAMLLLLVAGSAHAQTITPGYDRPAPNSTQSDGHQHVVYWSNYFDQFNVTPQIAADAYSVYDLPKKNDRKEMNDYNKRHPQQKSSGKKSGGK